VDGQNPIFEKNVSQCVLLLGSGDKGTVCIDELPVAVVPTPAEERAAEKYQSLNRTWQLNAKLHDTYTKCSYEFATGA
jgi:hypothetical protein